MSKLVTKPVFIFLFSILILNGYGQSKFLNSEEIVYTKVITERATKIVAKLGITDSIKYKNVLNTIINQYRILNTHHEQKETEIKTIKDNYKEDELALSTHIKVLENNYSLKLNAIHENYISLLLGYINSEQIDKVKDAMTYNVLPNTYKAYQEMLPNLTKVQKEKILNYLNEARDHAMDAPSSKAKHAWFGKYKGKINNYLSSEGIDMKKESLAWEERIKK